MMLLRDMVSVRGETFVRNGKPGPGWRLDSLETPGGP